MRAGPARYRVMQVTRPGVLELAQRIIPDPQADQVLIAIEACGICGADIGDIERPNLGAAPPRVPGHEVVGRIISRGADVPAGWHIGQRVSVGRLGGHCGQCAQCREGRFVLCPNQPITGVDCDGGYAEMMLARAAGLVAIPEELGAEEAAPILCAGVATFNALRKAGAEAGDLVAIQGVGGLGHMALQYAQRMGFKVVAIGCGQDDAADAARLGAHVYVDARHEDVAERLQELGGAQTILTTIRDAAAASAVVAGLAPQGALVVLGIGREPLTLSAGYLVRGECRLLGSITGSPHETEQALNFSVLTSVRPWIETMPLEEANGAFQRMKSGRARYRMVLTMEQARGT